MKVAYLSDNEIAALFGRSLKWFRAHRDDLQARGFPSKDSVVGLTLGADVEAWLARQRKVTDHVTIGTPADDTTLRINTDAL